MKYKKHSFIYLPSLLYIFLISVDVSKTEDFVWDVIAGERGVLSFLKTKNEVKQM